MFGKCGGTIGRGGSCARVLPNLQHFLSSRHAAATFEDDEFPTIDTSSNGVFINRSNELAGSGRGVPLHGGDVVTLGDYQPAIAFDDADLLVPSVHVAATMGTAPDAADPRVLLQERAPPSPGRDRTAPRPRQHASSDSFDKELSHNAIDALSLIDGDGPTVADFTAYKET